MFYPRKDEENFKKWINRLTDGLERLVGMAIKVLPAIKGSVVGATLGFLGKAVGFVVEHTRQR